MSREILIQSQKDERLVAIVDRGHIEDFYIEADRYQSLLGNVYKGKVESILPSINAAFINIGQEKNGFLYLTDVVENSFEEEANGAKKIIDKILGREDKKQQHKHKRHHHKTPDSKNLPFKVGQEVLVQVVKDPFGEKGARLTTHVSLPGRFVVYMPFDDHTGISKKIENPVERARLRDVSKEFEFAKKGGFIIRTVSLNQGKDELVRDAKFLYKMWLKIYRKAEQEKAPVLIYQEGELIWKIVRDYLTDKTEKVITDNQEDYEQIGKFVETLIGKPMMSKVELYKGKEPLFDAKNITKELQTIYDTHVHVRSGAYVVIEPTEAITVVDVNSGKFKVKASPEDAAFMVNMEVVPEIARQLRLRDVGGIIVIDFIDMNREEHRRRVYESLVKALSHDGAKTEVFRISQLGLVEMTRARTGKTIESISFVECPYCTGRGRVKIV